MGTMVDKKTTFIQNYFDVIWKEQDLSRLDEFFNPNATYHTVLGTANGIEAIKNLIQEFQDILPDCTVNVEDIVIQEDKCACMVKVSGTGTKDFFGVNLKNKKVSYEGTIFAQLKNNKIQELKTVFDYYNLLVQAGAIQKILQLKK